MNDLLNTDDLADVLDMQPQTLREWRTAGRGPAYVKVGRLVRYAPEAVESWLAANSVDPSDES